ncbi:alpha/beta hydrolase [Scopulibacillus darangshiensis]|nr:alpha/beta hydrolase [Scopulibacillus darangshiensis]
MKHLFKRGHVNHPTLLLLHGTGGNEHDLLPIGDMIDDKASVLSVRGNVNENGMPRFFRRLAEGVFDEEDLIKRTKELADFIDETSKEYGFERKNVVAVGYSNGANIAGSLLFHNQNVLKGACLFHPMVPRRGVDLPDLSKTPVFIGAGRHDPICSPEETDELAQILEQAGAAVEMNWEDHGHQLLSHAEVKRAAAWYERHFLRI